MRSLFLTDLGRLRLVAFFEGISYLLLLGIAVPLKYLAGDPSLVRWLGRAHGFLFVLFLIALALVAIRASWRWTRVAFAFVASLLPFGTFVLDRSLRREQEAKTG